MPTLNRKICQKHGFYTTSRCKACSQEFHKNYDQTKRNKINAKFYHGAPWKKVRKQVLMAEPICRMCQEVPATLVDHIVEIEDGGDRLSIDNLQPLCNGCHNTKTSKNRNTKYRGAGSNPTDEDAPTPMG